MITITIVFGPYGSDLRHRTARCRRNDMRFTGAPACFPLAATFNTKVAAQ